jgi:hypothetical protein
MSSGPRLDPSAVLAAYAEPIVVGRRVIVFGNALSGLAEQLIERGARIVQVYDVDPGRVGQAATQSVSKNVAFGPLGDGGLTVREGAFDVGVIENLSSFGDAQAIVAQLRRALGPRGAALVVSPNPDVERRLLASDAAEHTALDYYGLYDLVAQQFPHVRMLGQAPFVGYAVVDFSPENEPEPSIDSGLLGDSGEDPDYFIALASVVEITLDEFAVIQLPWQSVIEPTGADLEELSALERELDRLRGELQKRETWISELEARANTADERADATQLELDQARSESTREAELELERVRSESTREAELELELERVRSESTRETELRVELAARLELAQTQLRAVSELPDVSVDEEQARLEAQLAERGQEIRRLQKELAEAERTGRELVRELTLSRAPTPAAPEPEPEPVEAPIELQEKLDALARLNAEREADLAATRWALQAVEARAELVAAAESRALELERELASLRSELERVDQTRGAS